MGLLLGFVAWGVTKNLWPSICERRKAKSELLNGYINRPAIYSRMVRLVKKLAIKSDVLLENFKPGSMNTSCP